MLENISQFDRFELKSKLHQLSVEVADNEETGTMRNLLKKAIVEELLKSNVGNKLHYQNILQVTKNQLHHAYQQKGYPCTLVGCRFIGKRHSFYVKHLKQSHPNITNILCNFKKNCNQRFGSVEDLVQHLKSFHSSSAIGSATASATASS